ncbi:beta-N-acetylhexosaminidase [uncultured Limnohabitans sp.]|jgi:beta-N-acetylhexosaminidase|uniref:beta-N-acetylhexosaminidase n=1 Tax=uncultured Limnohabitans sp. TaxID=768543 RepID=UPI00261908A5|nr:beta-N-acetylhexosaminidase [uncultured Limnohabitans sp.]
MNMHAPLILDIEGHSLSAVDRRRLTHPLVGGIILFGRNWHSRAQLTDLCADIKSIRSDLLISVDHEGGRVQRFRTDGFTHLPSMRAIGELWGHDDKGQPGSGVLKACEAATSAGFVLASELRACGVDFSFTPVLDLDHGESGVIGDRAFARDPRVVSLLARSLMQGLLQAGMGNCGKHFPGHGAVKADSHVALPVDKRSLKTILADDAQPYRWLGSVLTAVMPAHVIYSKVDSRPAGFSARWLQDILRGQLKFQGVVCTDDLSMAAARQLDGCTLSYTEAVITALQAGCDLALLCNRSAVNGGAELDEVLDALTEALLKGHWRPSEVSEERRLNLLPRAPARAWDELVRSHDYMQALDRLP